jgi:glycosyltransferase involved in cell wall biosynthesis
MTPAAAGPPPMYCDVSRLLRRVRNGTGLTGIDRVGVAYARWVCAHGGRLCVFDRQQFREIDAEETRGLVTLPGLQGGPHLKRLDRMIAYRMGMWRRPRASGAGTLMFNTSHGWLDSELAWAAAQRQGLRVLTFVHDLIPIEYPEYAIAGQAQRHRLRLLLTARHSAGIVANSTHTLDFLRAFAKQRDLQLPPAIALALGASIEPGMAGIQLPDRASARPYFVVLGTIEPRKNHLLLLTAWRELVARLGRRAPDLIVIGRRGWECEQVVDLLERSAYLRAHVVEVNDADDRQVAGWLAGARALLFPSFAEGFGMPLVEALAMGVPVIASGLDVFREVAGEVPDYVSPIDGVGWARCIEAYAAPDSPEREAQLQRMWQLTPPTWDAHFGRLRGWLTENGLWPVT